MPGYYGPRRYGYGPGPGWGRGYGLGRGYGRGWCWWPRQPWCMGWGGWGLPPPWEAGPYGPGPYGEEPPYASPREEMADIKEQEESLRGELEAIQKRLAEFDRPILSQEVLTRCQPLAGSKDIALELEFPPEVIVLQADPILFQRALCNLLENAIKYSPSQSRVVLTVGDIGMEVQFAVKDQGPGIAPEDQPHLFELLFRGKTAGQETGLGLGLAIVKRIIDAHDGRIWVESAPGKGTTFLFTLPKRG